MSMDLLLGGINGWMHHVKYEHHVAESRSMCTVVMAQIHAERRVACSE